LAVQTSSQQREGDNSRGSAANGSAHTERGGSDNSTDSTGNAGLLGTVTSGLRLAPLAVTPVQVGLSSCKGKLSHRSPYASLATSFDNTANTGSELGAAYNLAHLFPIRFWHIGSTVSTVA